MNLHIFLYICNNWYVQVDDLVKIETDDEKEDEEGKEEEAEEKKGKILINKESHKK